ncbi:MAG: acyltransferase [Gemmatimonadaceae bacterium]
MLDGLRGAAVLLVMFGHFGKPDTTGFGVTVERAISSFGWAGVDLFFVLSGFLITGILLDTRESPSYFRTFYTRRFLRIFPLYYVFLALVLWLWAPRAGADEAMQRQGWLWAYLTNVDLVRHGVFFGASSALNHLWSLAVEEHFYFVWPFFVLLLDRRGLIVAAILGFLGAEAARIGLQLHGSRAIAAYMLTPTRVDGLAIGALLAMLARSPGGLTRWKPYAPWLLAAAIGGVVYVFSKEPHFYYSSWKVIPVALPSLAIGFGALLLLTVAGEPQSVLQRVFRSGTLRFYGRYSYGLYVWHPLVGWLLTGAGLTQQVLARMVPGGAITAVTSFVLRTGVATGVALISWRVIEQPFLRLKDRATYAPSTRSMVEPARSQSAW